jgi:hypothetical protein
LRSCRPNNLKTPASVIASVKLNVSPKIAVIKLGSAMFAQIKI